MAFCVRGAVWRRGRWAGRFVLTGVFREALRAIELLYGGYDMKEDNVGNHDESG